MAKATKTTAVSVVESSATTSLGQLIDKLPELIASERAKLKELQGNDDDKSLSLDTEYDGTALKDISELSELTKIHASVNQRARAYVDSQKELELDGVTIDWMHNEIGLEKWNLLLKKAVRTLRNKAEIDSIKNKISKLEKYLPEDQKLFDTISELMADGSKKLR